MTDNEKLAELVASLVVPDRSAKADTVNKDATEKALAGILAHGKDGLVSLVGMLKPPGEGNDSKARYALHALARRVTANKEDAPRRAFAEVLASTLGGERPKAVQAFIVRQLQVAGGSESIEALGKLLTDEELHEPAAQALLSYRTTEPFRAALPRATGKARLAIVHALGTLRDRDAVEAIRPLVGSKDRDLHLTSLWAVANAGDPGSVETVMKTAMEGRHERVRTASVCLLLAERLRAAGNAREAARLLTHVRETFKGDDEAHFREAAQRALGGPKSK